MSGLIEEKNNDGISSSSVFLLLCIFIWIGIWIFSNEVYIWIDAFGERYLFPMFYLESGAYKPIVELNRFLFLFFVLVFEFVVLNYLSRKEDQNKEILRLQNKRIREKIKKMKKEELNKKKKAMNLYIKK